MAENILEELVAFPVSFNLIYGKIYDSKNREIGSVKTLASAGENKIIIGDFIAEAMNRRYYSETVNQKEKLTSDAFPVE